MVTFTAISKHMPLCSLRQSVHILIVVELDPFVIYTAHFVNISKCGSLKVAQKSKVRDLVAKGPDMCIKCIEGCQIIIIIIDFYGAYILRNLSSEAQQNRISRRNRKQGRAKVSIRTRDNRTFMVGMQFGIDMS